MSAGQLAPSSAVRSSGAQGLQGRSPFTGMENNGGNPRASKIASDAFESQEAKLRYQCYRWGYGQCCLTCFVDASLCTRMMAMHPCAPHPMALQVRVPAL